MDFTDFLLRSAQPGYAPSIRLIAERWSRIGVAAALDGVDDQTLFPRMLDWIASRPGEDVQTLQMLEDIGALSWWRGPEISDSVARQIGAIAAPIFARISASVHRGQLPRVTRDAARQRHVLMVGPLLGTLHSPSRGAVDYAAALALDPDIVEIRVCHSHDLEPGLQAYIQDRVGADAVAGRVRFVNIDRRPDFLTEILSVGGGAFHFWCERPMSPYVTLLSWLGPTLMFTCGDERPYQYADVYWYFHSRERMAARWLRRGAAPEWAQNYLSSPSGPFFDVEPVVTRARQPSVVTEAEIVVATVGNRLGVDMDQAYISGMESFLRSTPEAVWMLVGDLPPPLLSACEQVLGERFRHVPYDPDLAGLLTTVDIFSNPFRAGGGASAAIALKCGAVVLTRSIGDVASLVPEDHLSESSDVYFEHLRQLAQDVRMRDAWRRAQRRQYEIRADQPQLMQVMRDFVATAHARYMTRLAADGAATAQ